MSLLPVYLVLAQLALVLIKLLTVLLPEDSLLSVRRFGDNLLGGRLLLAWLRHDGGVHGCAFDPTFFEFYYPCVADGSTENRKHGRAYKVRRAAYSRSCLPCQCRTG